MAKMTRNQLRALIRESINDVRNERSKDALKRRLNLKIAERKLTSLSNKINESSVELESLILAEGIFDKFKGGVSAAVSSLGREFLGGGSIPGGGYKKSGGLKSDELKKLAEADPLRLTRDAIKKVSPALKRLKSVTISDLVDGHGLIALDSYVATIVESLQELAKFMNEQRESPDSSQADPNEYLYLAEKAQETFENAKEIIKSLQRDIQQAAIDLQKGSAPALKLLNIDN